MDKRFFFSALLVTVSVCASGNTTDWGDTALAEESSPAANTPQDAPYANTLRWRTASEVDNFGFDVYRSESPDGLFTRITKTPVPGAGTHDEPSTYKYVDDTIKPDVTYYYYVESISMSSEREKFTPTFQAPIKSSRPSAPEAAPQKP